jgi:RNA polymerase sigma factor (sigma-70 family)
MAAAAGIYRHHTKTEMPSREFLEDIVSSVVAEFFTRNRFEPERGRLRTYLRMITNSKVVDFLRKNSPFRVRSLDDIDQHPGLEIPAETTEETASFVKSLLATLIEDLRESIPLRQFEIFEMVKLKGMPPDQAAAELGIKRGVVDNNIYKVMKRLREIAAKPEYQDEYFL